MGGTPKWFCYKGKIPLKWMMTGGTPISGNHHMLFTNPVWQKWDLFLLGLPTETLRVIIESLSTNLLALRSLHYSWCQWSGGSQQLWLAGWLGCWLGHPTQVWGNQFWWPKGGSPKRGVPRIFIHLNRIFRHKPSSYWGPPFLGNLKCSPIQNHPSDVQHLQAGAFMQHQQRSRKPACRRRAVSLVGEMEQTYGFLWKIDKLAIPMSIGSSCCLKSYWWYTHVSHTGYFELAMNEEPCHQDPTRRANQIRGGLSGELGSWVALTARMPSCFLTEIYTAKRIGI